jgi:hypothetical protein
LNYRILAVLLLFSTLSWSRTPVDKYYFAGVSGGYNIRYGRIDLGNDRLTEIDVNPLPSFGLLFGRNIPLPYHLRMELSAHLEMGSVKDGRFEDVGIIIKEDGEEVLETVDLKFISRIYQAGLHLLLELPFRNTSSAWPFLAIGPGVHYVVFEEDLRPEDGRNFRVYDDYIEEGKRFCFSAAGGGGFEMLLFPGLALRLTYLFRLWKPVERLTARDLFPLEKKPYYEIFHTHAVYLTANVPAVSP